MSKRRHDKMAKKLAARISDFEKTVATTRLPKDGFRKPGSQKCWKSV